MKRVLVTGGAGFIGSHIVRELVRRKFKVRILDNFSSGKRANLAGVSNFVEIIRGDISSKSACLKSTRGVDYVLHQAALRSVPKSMSDPDAYNRVNIQGTLNMLEASRANKVKRFVCASSSSVYGETDCFPESELALPDPISPYALSKLTCEHYCRIYSLHFELPTVALRYFNVFGPRQSLDDEYAVVVPKFITCILHDEQPPIFGNGKQSRDFTYVGNVVEANICAMLEVRAPGKVFNVASGHDYSVLDLVKVLNTIIGKNIKPKFLPLRKGDVFRTLADLTLAKKYLKFSPKTDFESGLKDTVEYFKKNG